MLNITEIRCKQACNKLKKGRLPFDWDLNIYRGCQHGCAYCYAIYSHEYLQTGGNYYEDIFVKINIVEQLEKLLSSPSWKREEINIGGVTDSYQPLEAKYKFMPDILRLLIKYQTPCTISTKSDLVLRDYDLIDELSRITSVNIGATITSVDEAVRKKIEPGAKSAAAKFKMLKELSKTNATTGLHLMPIIPYLTDQRENIEQLYASAADSKVNYVMPGVMYLRGKTRGNFFDFIKREYPQLFAPLAELYRKGGADKTYKSTLYQMVNEIKRKYRLSSDYINPKREKINQESPKPKQLSLFEISTPKNYQAAGIPPREGAALSKPAPKVQQETAAINLDPFVEIEMGQSGPATTNTVSASPMPAIDIDPVVDERRALFYSMRQIARDTLSPHIDHTKIFYEQALFMSSFEDDYSGSVPLIAYYPDYQKMGYEQLRTYFTWRTAVRKGNITNTSVAYGFLYIYELLNNVGVEDPVAGLQRLVAFWTVFRAYHLVIDQYVLTWMKDYHVYYPLPHSFQTFAREHQLLKHYPATFCYESGRESSFELFAGISKYNIEASVFYCDETREMIQECFYFVLSRLRAVFGKHESCFEDLLFYPTTTGARWMPFSQSLFHLDLGQRNRQVVISEREIYQCRDNRWTYKTVILSEQGKQLIGYIMKEMECSLRKVTKFKYKLASSLKMCPDEIQKALKKMGIVFPQFIEASVSEFYQEFTRIEISVDHGNVNQIRKEALQTQEKLIVPEVEEVVKQEVKPKEKITNTPTSSSANSWQELQKSLTKIELEALAIIVAGGDIKEFALKQMMMLEVIVDEINQKALDYVGDAILEVDDQVVVYEEYREQLILL